LYQGTERNTLSPGVIPMELMKYSGLTATLDYEVQWPYGDFRLWNKLALRWL